VVNDVESYPPPDSTDAVLITGSRHSAFEDEPWIVKLVEYTKKCIEGGTRVVGVCFGHQIVGRALGVDVGRCDKGWELAVIEVELTEKGKQLFQMDKMVCHFLPCS
jgi:GMP synthase-like glutamine amidotransferase